MGGYAERLDIYEYDKFVKDTKVFLIQNDMSPEDLAYACGYAPKTVRNALRYYDRCSRFMTAMIKDYIERYEERKVRNETQQNQD